MRDEQKLEALRELAEAWANPQAVWPAMMVDYGQIHREIGEQLKELLET